MTQLWGKIVPMIRKALLFVKTGGQCTYSIIKYLKNPDNANKETSVKVLEIGKLVTVSMTTAGAIGLGMAITGVLDLYVPALSVPIPILGSPSSLLGVFFGGLTSGICGAIVLNYIDGALENKMMSENTASQMTIQNNILALQSQQFSMYMNQVSSVSSEKASNIKTHMTAAIQEMKESKESISDKRDTQNQKELEDIALLLDDFE